MFEGNASYLFVGNVASTAADAAAIETIAAGSVAFCTEAGAVEKGAATTGKYRLAQKLADGTLIFSPEFDMATRKNVVGKSYVQPTRQVSFLGYNGSSGALDATASEDYIVHLEWKNSAPCYNNTPLILSAPYHTTAASQKELAFGLLTSLDSVLKRQPYKFIVPQVVGDGTVAAITGTSTITKVTKGSKGVAVYIKDADGTAGMTASTASVTDATVLNIPSSGGRTFTFDAVALGSSAGHHLIVIGETTYLVADAGTAAQNGTAIAAAINAGTQATASVATATLTITYNTDFYGLPPMVLSSDDDSTWAEVAVTIASGDTAPTKYDIDGTTSSAATFTLSNVYNGETGYIFDGTTAATNSGIATVANYGIKFSGAENSAFNAINDQWYQTRFDIMSGDFSTATVTHSIKADEGSGYWKKLANQEIYSQYLDKDTIVSAYPRNIYRQEISSSNDYDVMSFEISAETYTSPTTGLSYKKSFRIIIATEVSLAGDDADTVLGITV